MKNRQAPQLVAHRGYPEKYPENSLIGIEAALQAGACFVEFDVQLTSDLVPVVIHDADLIRCSGIAGSVLESPISVIEKTTIGEPNRFGEQFNNQYIPRLEQIVSLFKQWPGRMAFVEIKRSSLRHFGIKTVIEQVQQVLAPILNQSVLISYNHEALDFARQSGTPVIGWVFETWEKTDQQIANNLLPDYLITDHLCIPKDLHALWQGPWQWMVYEISRAGLALEWGNRVPLIETNDIGGLFKDFELAKQRCN